MLNPEKGPEIIYKSRVEKPVRQPIEMDLAVCPEKLSYAEKEVYKNYLPEYQEQEPSMDDFSDVYPLDKIKQDKEKLAEIKKTRQFVPKTKRSEILEAVLAKQIEQANWLGENCHTSQTAEYDDILHHADLMAEFRQGNESIRLAIDVTTTENREILNKKIGFIEKDIKSGHLTTLDYYSFKETEPHYKGAIKEIPRVIIGTDKKGVKDLSELTERIIRKEEESNMELANDHIQIEFLEQIKAQLEYFIKYTKEEGRQNQIKLINQQKNVLNVINGILENKRRSPDIKSQRASLSQAQKFLTSLG